VALSKRLVELTAGVGPGRIPRALQAALLFTVLSAACEPTAPNRVETWGSDQASVRITGDSATVQVSLSGDCYGAYGSINHAVQSGTFALSGTYTQLIGAYPGSVQYPAAYTGTIVGNAMTLSISVPGLQQTIGPFQLTAGVPSAWSACLYP
jgi:hypothetical protein